MKDLYKILGVAENADEGTIKKAYRKLAKEFHPDVTGNDKKKTERFKEINEAYDVLGDKEKRAAYTRLKNAPVRSDGMPEGFDPEVFARTFGGGVHMGRGESPFGAGGGAGVDVGDIFASLFGDAAQGRTSGGWGRGRARQSRGNDMAGEIEVSLAEAALGTKRRVQTGAGGNVEVSIPPGVESGARLRVSGQGGRAPSKEGVPGDLFIDINVLPDPHLRRAESDSDRASTDLDMTLPVTVSEAALGAKVQVPTVEGPVTVTVPPGTSSGAKLRLRGRGIKRPDGTRGDQICRIEIVVPKGAATDAELRRLFEELAHHADSKAVRDF